MEPSLYIGIVSHHHDDLIMESFRDYPASAGNSSVKLALIDNVNSERLAEFAAQQGIFYYADEQTRGYGANINKLFALCRPKDDDLFIVCNPDIILPLSQLERIAEHFRNADADIMGVKVYRERAMERVSSSNRSFPCILDFFVSFVFKKRLYLNDPEVYAHPDWISGAFMVFKPASFRKLGGFDEDFFMYCEDIDICYRAKQMGMTIVYDPSVHVIHESQLASRSIFSSSFLWHLRSVVRYLRKHHIRCLFGKGAYHAKQ